MRRVWGLFGVLARGKKQCGSVEVWKCGRGPLDWAYRSSDIRHPTSDIRHPTSDIRHPTSDIAFLHPLLLSPFSLTLPPARVFIDNRCGANDRAALGRGSGADGRAGRVRARAGLFISPSSSIHIRRSTMSDRLRTTSFLALMTVLLLATIANIVRQAPPIGWIELILAAIIAFIAGGDRIARIVLEATGFKVSIDNRPERVQEELTKIEAYVTDDNTAEDISKIIDDSLEHTRDIWSRLVLIRIVLRRLLQRVGSTHDLGFVPESSISKMKAVMRDKGIIDNLLAENIEKLRNATYAAEWGTGEAPKLENIKFALEQYESVFQTIKSRVRQPTKSTR